MNVAAERDVGLRRQIGLLAFAAAVVNGVVGAGIFTLPATMAGAAGPLAMPAYLVCALAMGAVVLCFAEAGSRLPTSGGVYGTVRFALGPLTGFVCGILTWTASVLACGGIAGALADTVGAALPALSAGWARSLLILGSIGGIALINLRGVRTAAWTVTVVTLVKLLPLLVFVLLGAAALIGHLVPAAPHPAPDAPVSGLAKAVILGVFAFSGMETPLAASGEVADGHRNVPRALFGALGCVLLLYVAIQLVAHQLLGADLADAPAPLAPAAGRIHPGMRALLLVAATVSMLGWIGSDILGAPRILFAFARDGLLPRWLGRTSAAAGTPDAAILLHSAIAAGLALSGSFTGLVVASTLNTAALYFLGCAAAWVLHRRGTRTVGIPVTFRLLPAAALGGMAAMAALVCVAPGVEIAGLFGVIVVGVLLYLGPRAVAKRVRAG